MADKKQAEVRDHERDRPEGSKQPEKSPIGKDAGRAYEEAAKEPQSPGQPAQGE